MLQQKTDRRWQLSRPWGQGAFPTNSKDTDLKALSPPQSLLIENLGRFLVSERHGLHWGVNFLSGFPLDLLQKDL